MSLAIAPDEPRTATTLAAPACLYCGSTDLAPMYSGVRDRLGYVPGERTFCRCRSCRSAVLDPLPKTEDLPAFFDIHPLHKLYGGENALQLSEYRSAITAAGFNIRSILSPLESPINYAPQTLLSLQGEVAKRLTRHLPYGLGSSLAKALLETPLIWAIARRVLTVADRRPGRLYSFVCTRPS